MRQTPQTVQEGGRGRLAPELSAYGAGRVCVFKCLRPYQRAALARTARRFRKASLLPIGLPDALDAPRGLECGREGFGFGAPALRALKRLNLKALQLQSHAHFFSPTPSALFAS